MVETETDIASVLLRICSCCHSILYKAELTVGGHAKCYRCQCKHYKRVYTSCEPDMSATVEVMLWFNIADRENRQPVGEMLASRRVGSPRQWHSHIQVVCMQEVTWVGKGNVNKTRQCIKCNRLGEMCRQALGEAM